MKKLQEILFPMKKLKGIKMKNLKILAEKYNLEIIDEQLSFLETIEAVKGKIKGYHTSILVDLRDYDMSGKELEKALDSVRITCNKNTIPNDPRSPFVTSGIRLGTPAITTRGFKEEEMDLIAEAIAEVIKNGEEGKEKALKIVEELTKKIPLK